MENLNEIFDIEEDKSLPIIVKPKPIQPSNEEVIDKTLIPDFTTARDNIDAIMEMGRTALEKVLEIASAGQHPRFYEAAAVLIKNLSDANKDYMDGQLKYHQIKKIKADLGGEQGPKTINIDKAVFTGTTSDLLKQINPRKIME